MSNKWRTELPLSLAEPVIYHHDCLMFLGSCFSENITERISYFGLRAQKNPVGILYNPVSIARVLTMLVNKESLDEASIIERDSMYVYDHFHGDFNAKSKKELVEKWTRCIDSFHVFWAKAKFLFVTLGSANVYTKRQTGDIVGNCHKQPSKLYKKSTLSIQKISDSLRQVHSLCLESEHPKELILTCSPVRHLRDGLLENSKSKAHLLSGIHQVVDSTTAVYFPSYELMIDDLRDYRFYKDDLLHPTDRAVDYIWEKFSDRFFDSKTKELNRSVEKLRKQQLHRSFHENSEANRRFQLKIRETEKMLIKQHPYLAETIENK